MSNKIYFREANINDLELLKYWDTKEHVIESDPNDDWNWEVELKKNPSWRKQFIAMKDKEPIGIVQIIDPKLEEEHYWGEIEENLRAIDIWIGEEENLGKGYGSEMMNLALEHCFKEQNVKAVLIDPLSSNKRAQEFYKRCGFKFVEERKFGDDICSVYQINREDWKKREILFKF